MSYHIYTTDGIILKRTVFGEANILLHVLTEDLGLIMASARSARLSTSKLRPALQEYSVVSISCVKGKGGWKITNVAGSGNLFFDYPEYSHKVLAQVTSVLIKMIQGEAPHKEVFHTVKSGFEFLKNVGEENLSSLETLLALRILFELGYVAKSGGTEKFLDKDMEWTDKILEEVGKEKTQLIAMINKALKESHL